MMMAKGWRRSLPLVEIELDDNCEIVDEVGQSLVPPGETSQVEWGADPLPTILLQHMIQDTSIMI